VSRLAIILTACALAACVPVKPNAPQVVTVTVDHYVAIPQELTQPCPIAEPVTHTGAEALTIAKQRRASLETCNDQLTQIRSLGTPNVSAGNK
jgi:hypothetical protein